MRPRPGDPLSKNSNAAVAQKQEAPGREPGQCGCNSHPRYHFSHQPGLQEFAKIVFSVLQTGDGGALPSSPTTFLTSFAALV